jgi:hypothetical protein
MELEPFSGSGGDMRDHGGSRGFPNVKNEAAGIFHKVFPEPTAKYISTIVVVYYGKSRTCFLLPSYTKTFASSLFASSQG